ncbi:hypothetical protein JF66_14950, partial [Cryobacterium sp. MLB-32]|uniref:hypothetical protein n=1 Tax=Cryobacterium sp. MLB-32 TaxID=1529318 RepID=UPI0004E60CD2
MSIYKSSVESYRDTTKWLAAFTPVTAILTAVVVTGAPVGASLTGATDAGDWFQRHAVLGVCVLAIFVAVAAILWRAAAVLSVEPREVVTILKDKKIAMARAVESAFGVGMLAPDFFTEASFMKATQVFYAELEPGRPVPHDRDRLVAAFESLREWKMFLETRRQFRVFLITLGIGAAVICAAIAGALTQIPTGAPIGKPVVVAVTLDSAGADAVRQATGCTDPARAEFSAVGGTWGAPTLTVTGPGCAFGATWVP